MNYPTETRLTYLWVICEKRFGGPRSSHSVIVIMEADVVVRISPLCFAVAIVSLALAAVAMADPGDSLTAVRGRVAAGGGFRRVTHRGQPRTHGTFQTQPRCQGKKEKPSHAKFVSCKGRGLGSTPHEGSLKFSEKEQD